MYFSTIFSVPIDCRKVIFYSLWCNLPKLTIGLQSIGLLEISYFCEGLKSLNIPLKCWCKVNLVVHTRAALLQIFCESISRHQIVVASRLFMNFKGQNLLEVQLHGYYFVLKHCHDQTGKNEEYVFLRKLTKVCSSTKIMRIMPMICSQLPLANTSYIIFECFFFKFRFFPNRKSPSDRQKS